MAIGETILGAVLQVVFDRLASQQVLNLFKSSKIDQSLVDELRRLMLVAEKLLADAEQKQVTDAAVKKWLNDLEHLFYQAEDIANEIATEALRSSLDAPPESESLGTKVRNLIPTSSSSSSFAKTVNSKISEVVIQLNNMVIHSGALNLREGSINMASGRMPTTYLLEDTGVFGRDQEKEELIKLLQSEEAERSRISVVAIVGMGGIGKTTLAKLVYNDESLKHFDLKTWVYVSDQFDISRVTKSILQSVTDKSYSDSHDLNYLQHELSSYLRDKRFFLVLDDVWNENYQQWECLRAPLTVGAPGSKIIVTTRNDEVASIMRTTPLICLKPLADDDGWSLFSKHAFVVGNSSCNARKELLGRKIVDKCRGLPLTIKTLGGLLRSKEDINDWEAILQSNLWDLSDNKSSVAPALRLSYHHLSSHLKQCFSYCAIFPKGYEFDRKRLVLLWMAENFVQPCDDKRIEDIGEDYLNQLLSRSFFINMGNHMVMHDLMHDLAVDVSGKFVARLEQGETASNFSEKARHFSFVADMFDLFSKFETLYATKYLRTFIKLPLWKYCFSRRHLSKKIPDVIIPKFYCLYVLSLTNYHVLKLPESIANLKQLRYLDVSGSGIKELPELVSTLCNLQTLLLSNCKYLERLPAHMTRLVSLRHLDISGTIRLRQMPMNIGKLNSLQTLSGFVVRNHSGQGIEELRELQQIRGKLALRRLQNVSSPIDALDANLSSKEYINELALEFDTTDVDDSEDVRVVLENLMPNSNLERLTIQNYPGTRFPSWLNTHCSIYNKIINLCLRNCKHCFSLPLLGQLPSLEELEIVGMEYIEAIGPEFYYVHDSAEMNPFPKLRSLVFKNMKMWKEWSGHEEEGRCAFSCLKMLRLVNCPELKGQLPANICSLKEVEIVGCERLERSLLEAPSNSIELSRHSVCKYTAGMLSLHLTHLELSGVKQLVSLPPDVGMLPCLETLLLNELEKLKSLENVRLATKLKVLSVVQCGLLECLPKEMDLLNHLVNLTIVNCPSLERSSEDNLPTSLHTLEVRSCKRLEFAIPVERMRCYSSLERLFISDIGGPLVCFPLGAFPNLYSLFISNSRDLETVYISSVPSGSDVMSLKSLEYLSIRDCGKLKWIGKTEEEGIVDLPTPNLQYLFITGCDIVKPLMGDREGLPSKLHTLKIDSLDMVETTSERNNNRNYRSLLMLSSLRKLEIHCHVGEYFPDKQHSLPISLTYLCLMDFQNLKKLNGKALKTLTSLQKLSIWNSPKLQCLPKEGLPPSLGSLSIYNCPLLEKRCKRDAGPDWPNICHIPCVQINF